MKFKFHVKNDLSWSDFHKIFHRKKVFAYKICELRMHAINARWIKRRKYAVELPFNHLIMPIIWTFLNKFRTIFSQLMEHVSDQPIWLLWLRHHTAPFHTRTLEQLSVSWLLFQVNWDFNLMKEHELLVKFKELRIRTKNFLIDRFTSNEMLKPLAPSVQTFNSIKVSFELVQLSNFKNFKSAALVKKNKFKIITANFIVQSFKLK